MCVLARLLAVIPPAARGRLLVLTLAAAFASAAEVVGMALVAALMARVTGASHALLPGLDERVAAACTIAWVTLAGLLSSRVACAQVRFIWDMERVLTARMLDAYLHMPYAAATRLHSAVLGRNVLSQTVATGVIQPFVLLCGRASVVVLTAALLLLVDVRMALAALLFVLAGYAAVYLANARHAREASREAHEAQARRHTIALEALRGARVVRVLGRQDGFLRAYDAACRRVIDRIVRMHAAVHGSRPLLECVAFAGIVALALYLHGNGRDAEILPLLALYAMAAYRLIPAVHDAFVMMSTIRFNAPMLEEVESLREVGMSPSDPLPAEIPSDQTRAGPPAMADWRELRLRGVSYVHEGASKPALRGVSLEVRRNAMLGVVGTSGAGKTTLLDVIVGLLEPQGQLSLDGAPLDVAAWQRRVGYVPQETVLLDDTLLANVAFGLPDADAAAAERAVRAAGLGAFLDGLADGWLTPVGEQGLRLSGGERQRLAIARALYAGPDVLVLDEATANLDAATERAVLGAVTALPALTIVVVSHRLWALRACDDIVVLAEGEIAARGTYDDLMRSSDRFRELSVEGVVVQPI